ncbi:MAG: c-type cytochrome [Rubripirellula sp.]|nr:c-type cytochrome [Rubripirellula sp.]
MRQTSWLILGLVSFGFAQLCAQEPAKDQPVRNKADAPSADAPSAGQEPELDLNRAGNEQVAEIMRTFGGRGVMADQSPPTPAEIAVKEFAVRPGFDVQLVAKEPTITQPLFLSWDSRGRLWVVQYRQYQYPAGLKVIRFDQHLRAVFDKVPDPPPHGMPGVDRITVLEDTNGDGKFDHSKDVIDGLNIATAVQVGGGGIWVLNPPYLLRYPDADRDDVPDGDPEVHLTGFGLQDTHSVANSLLWGPDGWLYGSNGSTTVGDVSSEVTKGVRFQGQCVWRYHPKSRVFEIYAEGGGNTFSLDIDSKGRVFTGTNGGNTRGWYFPQGSYSAKNWGKHGPLTNPYAFGFFSAMRFEGDGRRFPQAFCIYEGGLFPSELEGSIIAPNSLHNLVWNSRRMRDGSTYRTVDAPNLIDSSDRWFRPVYAGVGPDGAAYLADWYDTRLSHVSPTDDWHKESGRVYRIVPEGVNPIYSEGDLHELSSDQLLGKLQHANKWVRQRGVLELGWRADDAVLTRLDHMAAAGSLEAVWAVNLMGQLTPRRIDDWLGHQDPHIRRWVVRLLGDQHQSHPKFAELAAVDEDAQVRSQLASTAKRIAAEDAIPVIKALLRRDEDLQDLHQPLMIWWALESHVSEWSQIERMLSDPAVWSAKIFQTHITSRLMQRYAASASPLELQYCARLMEMAPSADARGQLMLGMNRAFQGRPLPELPGSLAKALDQYQASLGNHGLVLGLRQGKATAVDQSISALRDRSVDLGVRMEVANVFGEIAYPKAVPSLVQLATGRGTGEPALQRVAIQSLAKYDDLSIARSLLGAFGSQISGEHGLRSTAARTLATRPAWARLLLDELNAWRVRRDQIPTDVIQQLRVYPQPEIVAAVEQAFGKAIDRSGPLFVAEVDRLKTLLLTGEGNADAGKEQFKTRCGNCHQLFGSGKKVGPPLDGYDRGNLTFWLNAIVDPSLEIREGFQSYLMLTKDGRALNGMIASQDSNAVTLRNADNQTTTVGRDEIEILKAIPTSLMPADVLKELTDDQLRDLFAYLTLGTK